MALLVIRNKPVLHLVVSLTPDDKHSIIVRAKEKRLSVTKLSDLLGMSRPHFYSSLDSGFELSKFLALQTFLSLHLISLSELQDGAADLIDTAFSISDQLLEVF